MPSVERQLVAVGIVTWNDQLWLQRRAAHLPLGGLWEFPGGKVRPGEQPEAAVVREVEEETGLRLCAGPLLLVQDWEYPGRSLRIYFYHCPLDAAGCIPGDRGRWVPQRDLDRYAFPPANREVIRLLQARDLEALPEAEDQKQQD